ncbi:MAG: hypothetical protein ACOYK6_07140 [Chthoniobacterales bacterium]
MSITSSGAAPLDPWNSLDAKEHVSLEEGKQVLVTEKVKDAPWPFFHIYRLVHATPIQAAAVFWDVENAPHFIPHCVKAVIDGHPVSNVTEVGYELEIPIFSNEISKVRNTLTNFPHEGAYEISWEVLSSKYSKSGRGSFLVFPHDQETLICYANFVDPGSIIAPLLRTHAEKQVKAVVSAIADQIEYEVQKNPEQLFRQEERLKEALEK